MVASSPSGGGPGWWPDALSRRLLTQRVIVLGQQVDDEMANLICGQLLLLAAEDSGRDISLYINSPGGSVTAGLAIYDTMHLVDADVATYGFGTAASMGQFLLTAGAPGKRHALAHTKVLMHQPSSGVGGSESDIVIQAEQSRRFKQEIAELTAAHTGQTPAQIRTDFDRDRWFTPTEARDYGLIDQVITRAPWLVGRDG
jgi:ATP-dependent Clp protease protease subunit